MLTSCYTRKKAIEKFCKSDSVSVTIRDTITTEKVTKDTIFSSLVDTIIITKNKLSIKYIKLHDSIYLSASCDSDTIYYTKEVKVQTLCPSIGSYSFNEWLEGQPFWVNLIVMFILILALLYLFHMVGEWANKRASK